MVEERDLDEENGVGQQHNFKTNESLGMEGVDIVLNDYDSAPQSMTNGGGGGSGQYSQAQGYEESKQNRQSNGGMGGEKSSTLLTQWCPWMTLAPLAPYFQVNTQTVKGRVARSLIPYNRNFQRQYSESPDLYGPFWILTTLILLLFVTGNVERYSRHEGDAKTFQYNYNLIPMAAFVLYGVGLGLPLLVKCLVNTYGTSQHPTPLVNAVGIYGYSFASFLITIIFCAIPIDWLQWLLITYSAVTSLTFLVFAYWDDFKTSLEPKYRWAIIGLMGAVQLTLLILFKVYFFKHI